MRITAHDICTAGIHTPYIQVRTIYCSHKGDKERIARIFLPKKTHGQTNRQTKDRHTDRQTDRKTDRQTERQTDRRREEVWIDINIYVGMVDHLVRERARMDQFSRGLA